MYKCDEGGAGKKHPSTQTQKFPKEEKRKSFLVSFLLTFLSGNFSWKFSFPQDEHSSTSFSFKALKAFLIFFFFHLNSCDFFRQNCQLENIQTFDFNVWPGGQSMEVINWCMCSDKNINLFLAVKHQELFNFGFLRKSSHEKTCCYCDQDFIMFDLN